MSRPTAIVYVDGFNLYKGQVESRPQNKWLDFESLFDRVLSDFDVVKIHYFTANVRGSANPEDPRAPDRQSAFYRALTSQRRVEVHRSQFAIHEGRARRVHSLEWVDILKVQEKGSDVKLAVRLVMDATAGAADAFVVVSSDSDLAVAIEAACSFGRRVGVLYPRDAETTDFEKAGIAFSLYLHPSELTRSQMPHTVVTATGKIVTRPPSWAKS